MIVSTKGRYALRIMLELAMHEGEGYLSLKEISTRQNVSMKYLEQITTLLNKADLLKSQRGPQGGYRLSKAPRDYTIGEILRAVEGRLAPISCLESEHNLCPRQEDCLTIGFWEGLYRVIDEYTDSVTLADLLGGREGLHLFAFRVTMDITKGHRILLC